jgi:hypothetical protein
MRMSEGAVLICGLDCWWIGRVVEVSEVMIDAVCLSAYPRFHISH